MEKLKDKTVKEKLIAKIDDTAKMLYLEEIPKTVEKMLKEEYSYLEEKDEWNILEVIYTLTSKIEKLEFPIIYDGFMVDSIGAYLLGFTEIDPSIYEFKHLEESVARIFIPLEARQDMVDYAYELYGKNLKIEEIVVDELTHPGIDKTYRLKFSFSKIPIDLVVTDYPFQNVLASFTTELEENGGYTFDNKATLDFLHDEFKLSSPDTAIKELLAMDLTIFPEIKSRKTKVSMLYKLTLLNVLRTPEYYKTLLTYVLYRYSNIVELHQFLYNSTLKNNTTLTNELYKMYEDDYILTQQEDDSICLVNRSNDSKIKIIPYDLPSLYPFDLEECL